jgi:hypothetical protein
MTREATGPAQNGWGYKGEILTACSCDWGCPCNFNAPPTQGFCEGGWAIKINSGQCRDVSLTDTAFALICKWPRAIHEGEGTGRLWIDSSANNEQREALDKVVRGKLGGKPWSIFAATIDNWLETSYASFEWEFNGVKSHYKIGDQVLLIMTPMRNPVTGKPTPAKILLPDALTCNELNMASSESFSVFSPGLKYAWPGKRAWYGYVAHG